MAAKCYFKCLIKIIIQIIQNRKCKFSARVSLMRDRMRRRGQRWRQLSQFPGDSPLPLIGNALEFGFDADGATDKLLEMWKRHGKTSFRMSVGSEEWVLLCKPEHIAAIMGSTTELHKSPERNAAVMPFFGNSISTSHGDRWRTTRKLMAPSFSTKTLQSRLNVLNRHCLRLVEILDESAGNGDISMYPCFMPYMYDVLCESLYGIDSNLQNEPEHPYLQHSGKVVKMITDNYYSYWRNLNPLVALTSHYQEMQKIIKTITATTEEIITKRRSKLQKMKSDVTEYEKNDSDRDSISNLSDGHCLLDNLLLKRLPSGEPIPDKVINEEISFVGFTGHYTTSLTISHSLYSLAKYPEIQQRVLEEQRSIFNKDFLREPTMQDINEMKYLEAVIKETMRLIPTIPTIGRKLKNDLIVNDGRVIPSGSTVIIYYEALFMNEESFPEPCKFNPERFYERDKMDMYAFIPFGCGPRTCLGFRFAWLAMKATISSVLRRFEISQGGIGSEPQFAYRILTESKNGVHLKLKRR